MRLETTRLQDDLLNDLADCVIAPPPKEHVPGSKQPSCRLWSSLLHLFNQNSHRQFKYVSYSRNTVHCSGDTFNNQEFTQMTRVLCI